jgi:Flp pilus assembly protein TadD
MRIQWFMIALPCVLIAGCAAKDGGQAKSDYETVARDPRRDSDVAERHNTAAVRRMEQGDFNGAESDLKAALAADVMHGPAHNNLGKVYYHQGKFYLAAWEFQYAAKLMPNIPEPRNNLGLVFEAAGKLDDAVTSYDEAMSLAPDNVHFMGNLARARVRRGDEDDSVRDLLRQIVLRETRPDWADWARARLAMMSTSSPQ